MDGSTNELHAHLQSRTLWGVAGISFFRPAASGLAVAVFLTFFLSFAARAEQLPLRRYTTADGLASNSIFCVKRDSHGLLWFCTPEGLSRFDGYTFVNYGMDQGLPDRIVTAFVETLGGEYWVGTRRGLVQFNPKPSVKESMFVCHRLGETEAIQTINALLADHLGDLWTATNGGVFQLTKVDERWVSHRVEFPMKDPSLEGSEGPLMEDHAGNIWIVLGGPHSNLWRRRPGGELERIADPFLALNRIVSLFEDRQGRIWVGTFHGLALLAEHSRPGQRAVTRVYNRKDGLLEDYAGFVFQSSDGKVWAAAGALFEMVSNKSGNDVRFRFVGRGEQGFAPINAEDAQGNLWMGATRISTQGFVSYGRADGLAPDDVRSIGEGHDGELYVVTGNHGRFLHRFDDGRFATVTPLIPDYDPTNEFFWGSGQIHFQDHTGEWWVGTAHGLVRYPRVARLEDLARTRPLAIYTTHEGLNGDAIWRLYEDSRGDVWIGAEGGPGLTKWERATGRFHVFAEAEGWKAGLCSSLREDHFGNIWIGSGDGLARFREGRFTYFTAEQGYPAQGVLSMFVDHRGELWIATDRSGLVRVPNPSADHPQFVTYTTREGLSSNHVRAITEDYWGRIYFWTGRGVDRLKPESGAIRHYTEADGLVPSGSDHSIAFTDRHGRLWFGADGLSRLDPEPDEPDATSPPIRITGVRIRGVVYAVSELGETNLSGLVLDPDQNAIQIDFASLNFGVGQVLRFQYKLEGIDREWSSPSELRSVNYAKLRPGAYRFQVRTVNAESVVSSSALFTFRLMAPVWQRWWFLGLVAVALAFLFYGGHRYRTAQLLAVERIRTRIASDLHDDVGAGLSQIAILSEVVSRKVGNETRHVAEPLSEIAGTSRELVDSMSDIVWAIDPQQDRLSDLAGRMRRFAGDILLPRNINFRFHGPTERRDLQVPADQRRQIYLVFKESLNNIARHSGSAEVDIELNMKGEWIVLRIQDDGKGFDAGRANKGHGLASIRQRATSLGGEAEVMSHEGHGTTVTFKVPTRRFATSFWRKLLHKYAGTGASRSG